MKKSEFEKWFVEQHGSRPAGIKEQLEQEVENGKRAAQILRAQDEWDARFQTGLYSWNVLNKKGVR